MTLSIIFACLLNFTATAQAQPGQESEVDQILRAKGTHPADREEEPPVEAPAEAQAEPAEEAVEEPEEEEPEVAPKGFDASAFTLTDVMERELLIYGVSAPKEPLAKRLDELCDAGTRVACDVSKWRAGGAATTDRVVPYFTKACEDSGDDETCLVATWGQEREALANQDANQAKSAARTYKRLCDTGLDAACHAYGWMLFESRGFTADPRTALYRWEPACKDGHAQACASLAEAYESGTRIKADPKKAQAFAEQACELGEPRGCDLKMKYDEVSGVARIVKKAHLCNEGLVTACFEGSKASFSTDKAGKRALKMMQNACEFGSGRACQKVGAYYETRREFDEAGATYAYSCRLGTTSGCTRLVDLITRDLASGSLAEYVDAFEIACVNDSLPAACTELGIALLEGELRAKDTNRARQLLSRSCTNQSSPPRACHALARLYHEGMGGERDRTDAARLYQWACLNGNSKSCFQRGLLLHQGVGVSRNDAEAVLAFRAGCDLQDFDACYEAAVLLDEAATIERDAKTAADLYLQSCNEGVGQACRRLGMLYGTEALGESDPFRARQYLEDGVVYGDIESHRRLSWYLWAGLGGDKEKKRAKELCAKGCKNGDPVACKGPSYQQPGSL